MIEGPMILKGAAVMGKDYLADRPFRKGKLHNSHEWLLQHFLDDAGRLDAGQAHVEALKLDR